MICAPVIAIIDLAQELRDVDQDRVKYFSESAARAVRYLMERGLHFPTEGRMMRRWKRGLFPVRLCPCFIIADT